MMPQDDYRQIGIDEAKQYAKEVGLFEGQVVSHPDEKLNYYLREINGDTAVLYLAARESPTGEDIEIEHLLDELYDPLLARRLAEEAEFKAYHPSKFLLRTQIN